MAVDQLFAAENVTDLETEGDVLWPLTVHLGTPRDLATFDTGTNETTVANHRVYNASVSLTSEANSAVQLIFSFTGKPLDSETGFVQFVHRWYDPALGRWLSRVPLGLGPDTNDVRYVGNNALNLVDPSGLDPYYPQSPLAGAISNPPSAHNNGPIGGGGQAYVPIHPQFNTPPLTGPPHTGTLPRANTPWQSPHTNPWRRPIESTPGLTVIPEGLEHGGSSVSKCLVRANGGWPRGRVLRLA